MVYEKFINRDVEFDDFPDDGIPPVFRTTVESDHYSNKNK